MAPYPSILSPRLKSHTLHQSIASTVLRITQQASRVRPIANSCSMVLSSVPSACIEILSRGLFHTTQMMSICMRAAGKTNSCSYLTWCLRRIFLARTTLDHTRLAECPWPQSEVSSLVLAALVFIDGVLPHPSRSRLICDSRTMESESVSPHQLVDQCHSVT